MSIQRRFPFYFGAWRQPAHVNAIEALAPLVIIAHIAGKANATTAF
jgi:hypothetical protein